MLRGRSLNKPLASIRIFSKYASSDSSVDIEKLEQEIATVDVTNEDAQLKEERIQASRNKSRLNDSHRNMVWNLNPYPESKQWFHDTLKYKRKQFGQFGSQSGVDPAICWPTKQELEDTLEYERVAFPYTIPQMMQTAKNKRTEKEEQLRKQQEEILLKLSKLEGWKRDLEMRIAKKEAEANKSRLQRERLIEEVRKHFGYKVEPHDEKFQELLLKKEKEQKKIAKEARKKEREAKIMEKMKAKKKEKDDEKLDSVEKDDQDEEK